MPETYAAIILPVTPCGRSQEIICCLVARQQPRDRTPNVEAELIVAPVHMHVLDGALTRSGQSGHDHNGVRFSVRENAKSLPVRSWPAAM